MSNATTTSRSKLQRFNVFFGPFARDERLDFVDHVCGVLAESRFGPGSFYEPISEFGEAYGSSSLFGSEMPEEFFDLTERLRMHAQSILPVELRRSARIEMGFAITTSSFASGYAGRQFSNLTPGLSKPLPLARGSPTPLS